jgi:hypothetical protein
MNCQELTNLYMNEQALLHRIDCSLINSGASFRLRCCSTGYDILT